MTTSHGTRTAPTEPWPAELPCVWARHMRTSLSFYCKLGCEIVLAADGWAILRIGRTAFVLAHAAAEPEPPGSTLDLWVNDLSRKCRYLIDIGVHIATASLVEDRSIAVTGPEGTTVLLREHDGPRTSAIEP